MSDQRTMGCGFQSPVRPRNKHKEQGSEAKVRPDMRIVFIRDFEKPTDRLEGTRQILRTLVAIAEKKKAA